MLALNRSVDLLSRFEEQFKIHAANRAVASKGISWSYVQLDAVLPHALRVWETDLVRARPLPY